MTPRQSQCLSFIKNFWKENEHAPSYEEIRVALGAKSKSSVASLIDKLEERGYVTRIPNLARSIQAITNTPTPPEKDAPKDAPWG